ncbi:MAG: hypothetical protein M3022_05685 [Actinomycetota bacterium]|nr:hypothetical protein [Actinomycetota bacterium]
MFGVAFFGSPAAAFGLRRATVATGAGLATSVSLGVIALVFADHVSATSQALALIASGAGTVALLAVLPSLWAAARLRPVARVAPGAAARQSGLTS